MANRAVYITVRLDIDNPNLDEITDDDVQEVLENVDYSFKNYEDYSIETEICGLNDQKIVCVYGYENRAEP